MGKVSAIEQSITGNTLAADDCISAVNNRGGRIQGMCPKQRCQNIRSHTIQETDAFEVPCRHPPTRGAEFYQALQPKFIATSSWLNVSLDIEEW